MQGPHAKDFARFIIVARSSGNEWSRAGDETFETASDAWDDVDTRSRIDDAGNERFFDVREVPR